MTTLVFGAIHASTAAIWVLRHAIKQDKQCTTISETLHKDYYSDNLSKSFETEEEDIKFSHDSKTFLGNHGFNLTGFASSSSSLLNTFPQNNRAAALQDLNFDALPTEYVFGLGWDCKNDCYRLRIKPMPPVTTKRTLLSALARSFDPLGICLPVITFAKLVFQSACSLRTAVPPCKKPIGWDEPLPCEIVTKWNNWADQLQLLSEISIERCFRPNDFPLDKCVFDLIVFSDSSSAAFCAVAYLKVTCCERIHWSFVMAKGRIAPVGIHSLSIPRLELQAAVAAVRLARTIKDELRIAITNTEFRTDSQIVLHQIQSECRDYPTFIRSRVNEILQHSTPESWAFVSGEANPADDGTRGQTPGEFKKGCRWLNGPQGMQEHIPSRAFLQPKDIENLPTNVIGQLSVSPIQCSYPAIIKTINDCHTNLADLKREVAFQLMDVPASKAECTNSDLKNALRVCLITAAEESFQREMKALRQGAPIPRDFDLRKVNPYIDPTDGILKVNGRLEHAPLTENARHSIILSPDHRLTSLIINQAHIDAHHAGVEHTLASIRTNYYLLRGRRAVRKIIARCASCRFNNSMPSQPMMANLPKERLQPYVTPFSSCGLDLFGPLHTVIGRRTEKRWVMLAN